MTKAVRKSLIRSITNSLGRYLAILAITGLGVGLFSGLKVSKSAMVNIYDDYINKTNLYDYRLISTLGFNDNDVKSFEELDFIEYAKGSYSTELLIIHDGHESVYRLHTISDDINEVVLLEGRMPENKGECLVDSAAYSKEDIGKELFVSDKNKDTALEAVCEEKYVITGIINSPLYIHADRGSASIGNGKLTGFIYVIKESIRSEYYTEIYLTLDEKAYVYSNEYEDSINNNKAPIKELLESISQTKYNDIISSIPEDLLTYANIPNLVTYILDRSTNGGYVSYENDTQIVSGISNIFPVFFLMVAVLVCITTMVRMVEEERTQIGILKALGFGTLDIIKKYLYYACSASLIGWLLGYMLGTYIIPRVIWMAYNILYRISDLKYVFDVKLAAATLVISLLCSSLAVLYSCYKELSACPAKIMRPKAPKSGKRVMIEHITFLWNRLSFLMKVSVRNVFRYKNRLFMMILGVSGCTALLVAGFGIRDSVQNVAEYQYNEIMNYDAEVTFTNSYESGDEFFDISGYNEENSILVNISSADLTVGENTKSVSFVVFESDRIDNFINFNNNNIIISLPKANEAVISSKLAEMLKVSVGDQIKLKTSEQRELSLTISGIFENYIGNYVYISSDTYIKAFSEEPVYNCAFIKFEIGLDQHKEAVELLELNNVSNVALNADKRSVINNSLSSIDYIVVMVVVCAGALAFIVIYNLTNINIIERTIEIATINVLGFYPNETASYVLRENLILSGFGILIGLILGKYLHRLIMAMISVTNIAFDVRISTFSYFISFALTILFSMLVNTLMFVKLGKIPMAESLKTVE